MTTATIEILTADELAARLKVRPATIREWARSGQIPEIFVNSKVRRFDFAAVVEALSKAPPQAPDCA